MITYIKNIIAGFFLGIAESHVEVGEKYERAKKTLRFALPFLDKGFSRISYHLILAKSEYALGNEIDAKLNYDFAIQELQQHPECKEYREFKETLEKFNAIYGY